MKKAKIQREMGTNEEETYNKVIVGSKNDPGGYGLNTESEDSSACEEAQRGEGTSG